MTCSTWTPPAAGWRLVAGGCGVSPAPSVTCVRATSTSRAGLHHHHHHHQLVALSRRGGGGGGRADDDDLNDDLNGDAPDAPSALHAPPRARTHTYPISPHAFRSFPPGGGDGGGIANEYDDDEGDDVRELDGIGRGQPARPAYRGGAALEVHGGGAASPSRGRRARSQSQGGSPSPSGNRKSCSIM